MSVLNYNKKVKPMKLFSFLDVIFGGDWVGGVLYYLIGISLLYNHYRYTGE